MATNTTFSNLRYVGVASMPPEVIEYLYIVKYRNGIRNVFYNTATLLYSLTWSERSYSPLSTHKSTTDYFTKRALIPQIQIILLKLQQLCVSIISIEIYIKYILQQSRPCALFKLHHNQQIVNGSQHQLLCRDH